MKATKSRHQLGRDLPPPPPPQASISPTLDLGVRRSGRLQLRCIVGSCSISSSTTDTNALRIYGDTITVDAPVTTPDCSGPPRIQSGTVTISWTGTNRGDGVTSSGTTAGRGTLTTTVTWTVADDEGYFVVEPTGGGYWSNCPPTGATY